MTPAEWAAKRRFWFHRETGERVRIVEMERHSDHVVYIDRAGCVARAKASVFIRRYAGPMEATFKGTSHGPGSAR